MQELIEAAKAAATQFEHYAELHKAKGTLDGDAKALTNAKHARNLRSALSNAETLPALKAAGGWRPSREGVARIIEPWAFSQCEWASRDDNDAVLREYLPKRERALTKADSILALGAVPEGGEERGASRTSPSATPSGRPEAPRSAGGEG